jgi:guanine deaminase
MERAIQLAEQSIEHGGGPFGAVIMKDQTKIGEGHNMVVITHDPTAHAEILAIRNACHTIGSHSLKGCTIYTSCEPCPMCLAACYWAGIEHIYYANDRNDAAAIGFDDDFIYEEFTKPKSHRKIPITKLQTAVPSAAKAFATWALKTDKVPY